MCLDCGCGRYEDDHGDARHITLDHLIAAAEASGIPVDLAAERIAAALRAARVQDLRAAGLPERVAAAVADELARRTRLARLRPGGAAGYSGRPAV